MPNIHPFIVHFPIAFLMTAVVLDLCANIFTEKKWLLESATALYVAGTAFAFFAYLAGRSAAASVTVPESANAALSGHMVLGSVTFFFFTLLTGIRLLLLKKLKLTGRKVTIPLLIAGFLGFFFLYNTTMWGGMLVFEHGLGVTK